MKRKQEDQRWRVRERLSFGEAGMKNALVFYRRFERTRRFFPSIDSFTVISVALQRTTLLPVTEILLPEDKAGYGTFPKKNWPRKRRRPGEIVETIQPRLPAGREQVSIKEVEIG